MLATDDVPASRRGGRADRAMRVDRLGDEPAFERVRNRQAQLMQHQRRHVENRERCETSAALDLGTGRGENAVGAMRAGRRRPPAHRLGRGED